MYGREGGGQGGRLTVGHEEEGEEDNEKVPKEFGRCSLKSYRAQTSPKKSDGGHSDVPCAQTRLQLKRGIICGGRYRLWWKL
jgi:hypothetical protein